ncbi:MAG: Molybdenum cofactor cytidylyltransferase [uncultured Thermomicrobiales bacterium]|uniref:Molybdenum cofactor cytidylyltransferase n=1 Tax=uncultured Thermomicrobiales bacterium TaxID=1645740 RepID=A0A6J4UXI9_9BACT|nr:MAG: Molybdenum cofactor cytidylyltransferase [uncultured Thermomicrobiales bacterium]
MTHLGGRPAADGGAASSAPTASVSGIVLAAGRSTRLGRPKQLLPLAGEPVLAHVLRHAAASRLAEVVLVLGHAAETIAAAVGDRGQRVVVNPNFLAGQSTSLRAGLAAVDRDAGAVVVLLGDQPGVTAATIDALIAAFEGGDAPIVVPAYGGRAGNPVLFGRAVFAELGRVTGDEGARRVVRADPARVRLVDAGPGPPPGDLDTEDDYRLLRDRWRP